MAPSSRADDRSRSRSPKRRDRRERSRSRSFDHKKKKKKKKRARSLSSSSSSSCSEDDKRKKEKKSSRKKKKKRATMWTVVDSDSSSSSSSSESDDEDDKRRKKKKKSKAKKKPSSYAIDQSSYGKYGILRECDFHAKATSFDAWLREIKQIPEFNGPKYEAMALFREYMEDFNTATLPHVKYYDIEAYELKQRMKKTKKPMKKSMVNDEEALRMERQQAKATKDQQDLALVLQTMDQDKITAMREQERLKSMMQMHYKAGNITEARRLEQLLKPE